MVLNAHQGRRILTREYAMQWLQEFEALLTLSKGGLLDLNVIELDDTIDVSAVEPDDLARLLASCK